VRLAVIVIERSSLRNRSTRFAEPGTAARNHRALSSNGGLTIMSTSQCMGQGYRTYVREITAQYSTQLLGIQGGEPTRRSENMESTAAAGWLAVTAVVLIFVAGVVVYGVDDAARLERGSRWGPGADRKGTSDN
jgi:hypothetical protein